MVVSGFNSHIIAFMIEYTYELHEIDLDLKKKKKTNVMQLKSTRVSLFIIIVISLLFLCVNDLRTMNVLNDTKHHIIFMIFMHIYDFSSETFKSITENGFIGKTNSSKNTCKKYCLIKSSKTMPLWLLSKRFIRKSSFLILFCFFFMWYSAQDTPKRI